MASIAPKRNQIENTDTDTGGCTATTGATLRECAPMVFDTSGLSEGC